MDSSQWLSILLMQLWGLPYVLAYVIGFGLSLILWRRHPGVSLCAGLGFLILLGTVVLGVGMSIWFSIGQGSEVAFNRARVLQIVGVFRSLVSLIAYGFLITAIFGWRTVDRKQV